METYIEQLIADLKEKAKTRLPIPDYRTLYPNHPAAEYGLDHIIAWECATPEPFPELFGFPLEAFPPHDKLTEAQAEALTTAILELWAANGIAVVEPPEGVSHREIYREVRAIWGSKKASPQPEGSTVTFEFCNYCPEDCPWDTEHCWCKDIEVDDMDDIKPLKDGELPF